MRRANEFQGHVARLKNKKYRYNYRYVVLHSVLYSKSAPIAHSRSFTQI